MPRILSRNSLSSMDSNPVSRRRPSYNPGSPQRYNGSATSPPRSPEAHKRISLNSSNLRDSCLEVERLYEEELKRRRKMQSRASAGNLLSKVVAPLADMFGESLSVLSTRSHSFMVDFDRQSTQPSTTASSNEEGSSWTNDQENTKHEDICSWGEFVDISEEEHYTKYCRVRQPIR